MIRIIEHHKTGHKTIWDLKDRSAVVNEIRNRYNVYFDPDEWVQALQYHCEKLDLFKIETVEPV
jgi:hypothetical protein